jgi:hypothetical protein
MTDDQVQEALIRWLASITGLTVIKADQGVNRPALPFLMVEKSLVDELSEHPEQIRFDTLESLNTEGFPEVKATPIVELEWLMFVFSFGEGQSAALRKVKQAVYLRQLQESLGSGLNIHETGAINSVPELVNQVWEPRSQMNVMLRGVSDDGFVIDTIEETQPFDIERT